jgi:transcriptional regulator with XRE-family HTH domain
MNAIKNIRENVFKMKRQQEFADAIGVDQSAVSRWERGASPSLEAMAAIRGAAQKRRLRWNDKLFFEAPSEKEDAA